MLNRFQPEQFKELKSSEFSYLIFFNWCLTRSTSGFWTLFFLGSSTLVLLLLLSFLPLSVSSSLGKAGVGVISAMPEFLRSRGDLRRVEEALEFLLFVGKDGDSLGGLLLTMSLCLIKQDCVAWTVKAFINLNHIKCTCPSLNQWTRTLGWRSFDTYNSCFIWITKTENSNSAVENGGKIGEIQESKQLFIF